MRTSWQLKEEIDVTECVEEDQTYGGASVMLHPQHKFTFSCFNKRLMLDYLQSFVYKDGNYIGINLYWILLCCWFHDYLVKYRLIY